METAAAVYPWRMTELTRRSALAGLALVPTFPAAAQQGGPPPIIPFRFDDVVRRARSLAEAPFDAAVPPLPSR
jgi:glucans biosynthesis protein